MKVRATPDAGEGAFQAVVSAYDVEYDIGWGWTEIILPGAFADSIDAHPHIPIMYEHDWRSGPIGVGDPTEEEDRLTVEGHLYLDLSERARVIYQGMLDEALQEWSIAFWPETITNEKDKPLCDQIAQGDLAESSVCVRGANPGTETLDLRTGWIVGDEGERQREVARLRSVFHVETPPEPPTADSSGHNHLHKHGDSTHDHEHTHGGGNYDHTGADLEVTHDHGHPDDAEAASRAWDLFGHGSSSAYRSSKPAPSSA